VLGHVERVTRAAGAPFLLVGATARDVLLWGVHGLRTYRATNDIDVAVALPGWDQYDEILRGLLAIEGFSPDPKVPHRVRWQPVGAA
jgi:predicted nucleotidyltransferase